MTNHVPPSGSGLPPYLRPLFVAVVIGAVTPMILLIISATVGLNSTVNGIVFGAVLIVIVILLMQAFALYRSGNSGQV